jgi:hypothetical protein
MTWARIQRVVWTLVVAAWMAGALAAQQPQMEPDDPFVPIDQLPPQDQLAAGPLLVGVYSFALLALFVYLFSVARRLQGVQRELERLESDLKRGGHS